MTKHETAADFARQSVEIPLANAVASLLTRELAACLKILPTTRDALGRFNAFYQPATAPLYPQLTALAAAGLAVKDQSGFRLSTAGSLVRESLEDYGPGEDLNAAAILVDRALPNLDAVARERAILMAEALITTIGPDAVAKAFFEGV